MDTSGPRAWWRRLPSRPARVLLALACAEALAASLLLGYRWFLTSTPVSVSTALERYRNETQRTARPTLAASKTPQIVRTANPSGTMRTPAPSPSGSRSPTATPSEGMEILAPEPGVYSYRTEGTEKVDSLPARTLPPETQRVVTRKDGRTWNNYHLYSDQHEEWFDLTITPSGVVCGYFRAKISFGPFSQDQTITFTPPVRFSVYPFRLGQQWKGTFSGKTYGSYTGKTFDHTTLRIGDEMLEAWAVEVAMQLNGEVSGEATFRLWLSPKYRLTLKEQYHEIERTNGHTYRADITVTLLSTKPQR